MNPAKVFGVGVFFALYSAQAETAFHNRGFEAASLVPLLGDPLNRIDFSQAFPGWAGFAGPDPITAALYNNFTIGSPSVSLLRSDGPFSNSVITGPYTAVLQGGSDGTATALSQVGVVPADVLLIEFKSESLGDRLSL